jgi:hypothetical protein
MSSVSSATASFCKCGGNSGCSRARSNYSEAAWLAA